jgi:hypothetical protein
MGQPIQLIQLLVTGNVQQLQKLGHDAKDKHCQGQIIAGSTRNSENSFDNL